MTIAHRLETVMHYDKVLVLDKGTLAESGSPRELLENDTIFRSMIRENGPEFEKKMEILSRSLTELKKFLSKDEDDFCRH